MKLKNSQIKSLIEFIKRNIDDFYIFGVCVHNVGFEYRIKRREYDENEKINYISIEDILSRTFTLRVNLFDGNKWDLDEFQYDLLYSAIKPLWIEQGRRFEDRGLY